MFRYIKGTTKNFSKLNIFFFLSNNYLSFNNFKSKVKWQITLHEFMRSGREGFTRKWWSLLDSISSNVSRRKRIKPQVIILIIGKCTTRASVEVKWIAHWIVPALERASLSPSRRSQQQPPFSLQFSDESHKARDAAVWRCSWDIGLLCHCGCGGCLGVAYMPGKCHLGDFVGQRRERVCVVECYDEERI